MADRFEGKVVIVTGAASGIGAAAARRFAAEGAMVALIDVNRSELEKVASELSRKRILVDVVDVSDSDAVDQMMAKVVARFGQLDVMVNSAGVHAGGEPTKISNDAWRAVMATDVDGVFFGCRAALPHLGRPRVALSTPHLSVDWAVTGA